MENRPRSREKNVTGSGKAVEKRGDGLGTGPVGSADGHKGGAQASSGGRKSGGGSAGKLIALLLALLLGGGGGLTALLSGQADTAAPAASQQEQTAQGAAPAGNAASIDLAQLLGGLGGGSVSTGWQLPANTGRLDTSVAPNAREKYTHILGDGEDIVTLMVYMCGTDLESRSGMGTADLLEMREAYFGDSVNLLVYTGGCKGWKNSAVSSDVNQIWQVKGRQLVNVSGNEGKASMTDPATLTGYIRWCAERYPADRYALILWDHGGGSVSGYGYDEKFASGGSMDLAALDEALENAGVKFDFIGFDACLMATAETALTMARHADYLIASEETEPGVGWYYTDWLTALGRNTSMPTVELGQKIADSFVDVCAEKCRGQLTTLSVVDLAELQAALPGELTAFSQSTARLIRENEYQAVSDARNGSREFAQSSRIDHVDLVHLAKNMGTAEGDALAEAVLGAVKYNRTSASMTNAYGLSVYFPYRKPSAAAQAAAAFDEIGMDAEYTRCIQDFADMAQGGQSASGAPASPLPSLLGQLDGGSVDWASAVESLLNSGILSGRAMPADQMARYYAEHSLDSRALSWQEGADGVPVIRLGEEAWGLVHALELNLFYDDGDGYVDLGLDNVYDFDAEGGLLGVNDNTWLAINEQPVAYYHMATVDDGARYTITGRVPVMHNGLRAELILVFDSDNPGGYVAGVQRVYLSGETDTVAKSQTALQSGDMLEFLCDYYDYDGTYRDSYMLGEPITVGTEGLTVSDVRLDGRTRACYRFTDLYGQTYWSAPIPS